MGHVCEERIGVVEKEVPAAACHQACSVVWCAACYAKTQSMLCKAKDRTPEWEFLPHTNSGKGMQEGGGGGEAGRWGVGAEGDAWGWGKGRKWGKGKEVVHV